MRHRALAVILLAVFAIQAEAAQPVAVVLSQPVADESWADGVASGRGAENVFATSPWQEEGHRP